MRAYDNWPWDACFRGGRGVIRIDACNITVALDGDLFRARREGSTYQGHLLLVETS
jgi:hypothetical protein